MRPILPRPEWPQHRTALGESCGCVVSLSRPSELQKMTPVCPAASPSGAAGQPAPDFREPDRRSPRGARRPRGSKAAAIASRHTSLVPNSPQSVLNLTNELVGFVHSPAPSFSILLLNG